MTTITSDPTPAPPPASFPPFYTHIPNISNLRDAALLPSSVGLQLPTSSGHHVLRSGILFRSGDVSKLTRDGWEELRKIGVKMVFDLRSAPEVRRTWVQEPSAEGGEGGTGKEGDGEGSKGGKEWIKGMKEAGVERVWCPVFEESDYSPERLAERYLGYMAEGVKGFVRAYNDILRHAGPAYRSILLYLASLPPADSSSSSKSSNSEPLGALIHCTAGKDRTGMFFGILLSYLGVPASLVADEYNRTETGLFALREEYVRKLLGSQAFRKYLAGKTGSGAGEEKGKEDEDGDDSSSREKKDVRLDGAEKGDAPGEGLRVEDLPPDVLVEGRKAALRMVSARKETMLRSLEMVEREWGSAEGYLRKVCGLGDGELEGLRRALLVRRDSRMEGESAKGDAAVAITAKV